MLKILFSCFFTLYAITVYSQQSAIDIKRCSTYINLDQYLKPFWKTDTIYDESIQLIKEDGIISSKLLFNAKQILSIKDGLFKKEYKQGIDWNYEQGRIIFLENANIPFFLKEELLFTEEKNGISMAGKKPGTFVLFTENGLFQSKQFLVTYVKKNNSKWHGPKPTFSKKYLPKTINKLRNRKPFKLAFFGNSIEVGANSSGLINKVPYLPNWADMVTYKLQKSYNHEIYAVNKSIGGMMAKWGEENCEKLVSAEKPDLVIIGFGMNDGTFKIPLETFISQIKNIIDRIKINNKDCEFIVISTMLANPDAIQNQLQEEYRPALLGLQKKGVAFADITGVHKELLKHKSYQDMTGNNVNHPNDYLARWYAQYILAMLNIK